MKQALKSPRARLFTLYAALVAVVLLTQLFIYFQTVANDDRALEVNVAGRQRMLSQRMEKLSLLLASESNSTKAESIRAELEKTCNSFDASLHGLLEGGEVPGLEKDLVLVAAVENPQSKGALQEAVKIWDPIYHSYIEGGVDSSTEKANAFADSLKQNCDRLLPLMNQATIGVQKEGEAAVTSIRASTIFVVAATFIGSVVFFFLVQSLVLKPIEADRLEQELREAELTAARDAALKGEEAKTEFLSRMSHELRTPLNGIIGCAQVLREEDEDESRAEFHEALRASAERLNDLVERVLTYTSMENATFTIELNAIQTKDFVRELEKKAKALLADKAQVRFAAEIAEEVPASFTSSKRYLSQALLSVLNNAARNTEKGSVRLAVRRDGDWLDFLVEDTGSGIPKNELTKVFRKFEVATSQAKADRVIGMGLSLTKSILERLSGEIAIESESGKGTKVTIRVPVNASGQGNEKS